MGKFDRYGTPAAGAGRQLAVPGTAAARLLAQAAARPGGGEAARIMAGASAKVALALDATGSMGAVIGDAKAAITEIVQRATRESGHAVEIELFAYRDYDVPRLLLERSGAARDPAPLVGWLGAIVATGGGGNDGEAVEAVLQAVVDDGRFATLLLIGDEPSNSREALRRAGKPQAATAHELARTLGARNCPVHGFVAERSPRTVADFAEIALLSGGRSGMLDGSREMIDLAVLAILSALKGASGVRSYMDRHRLDGNAARFGEQLLLGVS